MRTRHPNEAGALHGPRKSWGQSFEVVVSICTALCLVAISIVLGKDTWSSKPTATYADAPHDCTNAICTLQQLNHDLFQIYSEKLYDVFQTHSNDAPILIVSTNLTLHYKSGIYAQSKSVWSRTEPFKLVSHIPLSIIVMTQPMLSVGREELIPSSRRTTGSARNCANLVPKDLQRFQHLHAQLSTLSIYKSIEPLLTVDQTARQSRIINASINLLSNVLDTNSICEHALREYAQFIRSDLEANVVDSAHVLIDDTLDVLNNWEDDKVITEELKENMSVIVMGTSHMAKRGHLHMQLFSRWLNLPISASTHSRLLYVEQNSGDGKLLLAIHWLDSVASDLLLSDPERLHEDVMAAATTEYLRTRLPQ